MARITAQFTAQIDLARRTVSKLGREWYGVEIRGPLSAPAEVETTTAGPWRNGQDARAWAESLYREECED